MEFLLYTKTIYFWICGFLCLTGKSVFFFVCPNLKKSRPERDFETFYCTQKQFPEEARKPREILSLQFFRF